MKAGAAQPIIRTEPPSEMAPVKAVVTSPQMQAEPPSLKEITQAKAALTKPEPQLPTEEELWNYKLKEEEQSSLYTRLPTNKQILVGSQNQSYPEERKTPID